MYLGKRDLCKRVPVEFGAALFYYGMDSKHVVPSVLRQFTKSIPSETEPHPWVFSDASFAVEETDMYVFEFLCHQVFSRCLVGFLLLLNTPMALAYLKRKALDVFPELRDQCPNHTLVNAVIHSVMWSKYKFDSREEVLACFTGLATYPSTDYSMKSALSIAAAAGRLEPRLVRFKEAPPRQLRVYSDFWHRKIKSNLASLHLGCTVEFAFYNLFRGLGPSKPTSLDEQYRKIIDRLVAAKDFALLYNAMPLAQFKAIVAAL